MQLFISSSCQVESEDRHSCLHLYFPPFPLQASKGFVSILRQLLQHGAKVNAKDNTGSTPLHRAAGAGKAEAVQVLVEEGNAKVDAKDKTGATPLFVAVSCSQANIAIYLASRGADVEVGGCWCKWWWWGGHFVVDVE
jgi:ankyrin repeat protein